MRGGPAISAPIDFALDIGCLHSLAAIRLQSYVSMLRRVLRVGGFYLLYAWGPRKLNGRHIGLMPDEICAALGNDFHAIWINQGKEGGASSYWYFFERSSERPLAHTV